MLDDLFARGFEFYLSFFCLSTGGGFLGVDFAIDSGGGEFAVGVEGGDETTCDEVEDFLFVKGHVAVGGFGASGNDGVVVGYLGGVEDFFAFFEFGAHKGLDKRSVGEKALENGRTFGIDVVAEKGGIDAGIGGEFLFVETLNKAEGFVGREGEFLVAFNLQTG